MRVRTIKIAATAILGVAVTSASTGQSLSSGKYGIAGKFPSIASASFERFGHGSFEDTGMAEIGDAGDGGEPKKSFEKDHARREPASITTTSYDEQSQTVVTRTLPATDFIARPSCNADGVCSMRSRCHVSFPGFIVCDTTTDHADVSTNPPASAVTFSTTLPKNETDPYSYQAMPTLTASGAAAKNGWRFPRMAGAATTTMATSTAAEAASLPTCATDAITFTVSVEAPIQKFATRQISGTLQLKDGGVRDQSGQMVYLGTNQEIMLSAIGSMSKSDVNKWSVCHNGRLMHDGNGAWCSCQSGTGTHIFQLSSSQYCMRSECEPVNLSAVSTSLTATTSEVISTSTVTAVITTTISSCPNSANAILPSESSSISTSCSESSAPSTTSSSAATTTSPEMTSFAATAGMRKFQGSEVVVSVTVLLTKTISPIAGSSTTMEASEANSMPSGTVIPVLSSKDGRCGADVNQTCLFSSFGNCCSKQGM